MLPELRKALKAKAGLTPAEEKKGKRQLLLLCRLDQSKMPGWKVVMHRLKKAEFDADWSIDISKVMFLKNNNQGGALVHGWRIILKSDDLATTVQQVTKVVVSSPNARVEISEVPLPGGGSHRHSNSGQPGKGASDSSYSRGSGPSLHLLRR